MIVWVGVGTMTSKSLPCNVGVVATVVGVFGATVVVVATGTVVVGATVVRSTDVVGVSVASVVGNPGVIAIVGLAVFAVARRRVVRVVRVVRVEARRVVRVRLVALLVDCLVTVVRFFETAERFLDVAVGALVADGVVALVVADGRETVAIDDFVAAVVVGRSTVAVGTRAAPALPRPAITTTATDTDASTRQRRVVGTMSRTWISHCVPFAGHASRGVRSRAFPTTAGRASTIVRRLAKLEPTTVSSPTSPHTSPEEKGVWPPSVISPRRGETQITDVGPHHTRETNNPRPQAGVVSRQRAPKR